MTTIDDQFSILKTGPFDTDFGGIPEVLLTRNHFDDKCISLLKIHPYMYPLFITGLRGSGKTVLANIITKKLSADSSNIVISVNNQDDLLSDFLFQLRDELVSFRLSISKLNFPGFSVELLDPNRKLSDDHPDLELKSLLSIVKALNKTVIVVIDDVSNTAGMRDFARRFNDWKRDQLPVKVLMNGLLKEVTALSRSRGLSFLLRADRIVLTPFDLTDVAEAYTSRIDWLNFDLALQFAKLTRGYAFAFQVLGALLYRTGMQTYDDFVEHHLKQYRAKLATSAYNEIMYVLSSTDVEYLDAVVHCSGRTGDIPGYLGVKDLQTLSPYRQKLLSYHLLVSLGRGKVWFTLPEFDYYLLHRNKYLL